MTRPGRRPSDPPYLHSVYGAIIDQVKSHKLLGIHLDQDLDFDIQTEVLCKSFSKKIGFLKHISPYFERSHKLLYYDAVHCIYVLHIVRFLILTLKTRHTWKPSIWFQASFSCCILCKRIKNFFSMQCKTFIIVKLFAWLYFLQLPPEANPFREEFLI